VERGKGSKRQKIWRGGRSEVKDNSSKTNDNKDYDEIREAKVLSGQPRDGSFEDEGGGPGAGGIVPAGADGRGGKHP